MRKIPPKLSQNCVLWKPIALQLIFVAGLACRLNGAAQAVGQFQIIGIPWCTFIALSFSRNRNAAHPVNAILNYAYATLESETRIKAISDGYDPTIGIMHEGIIGSLKFIFDLMEQGRPKVDRMVLDFLKGHVFDPADFVIRTDGVCRLKPEMARMVVAKVPT